MCLPLFRPVRCAAAARVVVLAGALSLALGATSGAARAQGANAPLPAAPATSTAPVAPAASPRASGAPTLPSAPSDLRLPGVDPRQCGTSKHAALCAEGRWARFAHIDLDVRVGSFQGTYAIEHTGSGEVHGTSSERQGDRVQAGEAVVVSEDAFAFRSRRQGTNPDGMLDQIMTSPTVFSELAAILLESALPEGPDSVTRARPVRAANASQFILTQAPGGTVLYGPPWTATGSVRPADGGALAFELELSFRPVDEAGRVTRGAAETVRLSGRLRYTTPRERLPDTFDLVGWKLVRAGALLGEPKTLAEARQMAGTR